jgi:Flp pilus assembly pilin Flp
MDMLKRFIRDEQGLETVEYAVILGLIVTAVVVAIVALRGAIVNKFNSATNVVNS